MRVSHAKSLIAGLQQQSALKDSPRFINSLSRSIIVRSQARLSALELQESVLESMAVGSLCFHATVLCYAR